MSFSTFSTFGTSEVISYAVGVGVGVGGMAGQGVIAGIVSGLLALSAFLGLQLLEWLLLRAWRAWQQRNRADAPGQQGKKPWSWLNWSPIHGQQKATSQPPSESWPPTYGQPHAAHPRASPLAHTAPDKLEPEDEEERDHSRREKRTFWS